MELAVASLQHENENPYTYLTESLLECLSAYLPKLMMTCIVAVAATKQLLRRCYSNKRN